MGREEPPKNIKEAMKTVKDLNPSFEYKFWGNEIIKDLNLESEYNKATEYSFFVNIARLKILKEYGGVYIDADVECLKEITPLYDEFKKYKLSSNFINNKYPDIGTIIAEPGIDYHMALVDYNLDEPLGFYWQRMKPKMLPEELIGARDKPGTYLKDLRLNSWVEGFEKRKIKNDT